jgi:hypothetical protein
VNLVLTCVVASVERQLWGILLRRWSYVHVGAFSDVMKLNVWERVLKSLSQFSEHAKLPLIVSGPLFAGIRSLR